MYLHVKDASSYLAAGVDDVSTADKVHGLVVEDLVKALDAANNLGAQIYTLLTRFAVREDLVVAEIEKEASGKVKIH